MSPNSTLPRKRLRVSIGPDRFHHIIASVNGLPTEIDTPLFVGRVLVLVKDFAGVTPDGSPSINEHAYFHGRSRKFAILVEGRFKAREGTPHYTGEEVQFGSDFDFLPASFPHGPFNAGMRIAKFIDPATFYEETPPSGRPFIMSPYVACMNTFCAYPAPEALSRAILLAHHDPEHPHHEGEEAEGGLVPLEDIVSGSKRVSRNYWRFLLGSPPVDAFVASHSHLLPPHPSTLPLHSPRPQHPPQHRTLGTIQKTLAYESDSDTGTPRAGSPAFNAPWGATILKQNGETAAKKRTSGRFSLATLLGGNSVLEEEYLQAGDLVTGDRLAGARNEGEGASAVERQLGPWRFGEEGVDAIEDTTFIFLDLNHTRTVAQRRKYFCAEGGRHRREFEYDPDIVYTASFFTNFCDLNTFDLSMGPINLNIANHFTEMPIRYTLRSTRLAPRPDGKEGPWEEEVFATIAFELVDA